LQPQVNRVKSKFFGERLKRLCLFVVTFILAALSVFGIESFSVYPFIIIFPTGLIAVLAQDFSDTSDGSTILGWLIYLSISLLGILTNNRRFFVFMYIAFVILLITNVVGCKNIKIGF